MDYKKCGICGNYKSFAEFGHTATDKIYYVCKECEKRLLLKDKGKELFIIKCCRKVKKSDGILLGTLTLFLPVDEQKLLVEVFRNDNYFVLDQKLKSDIGVYFAVENKRIIIKDYKTALTFDGKKEIIQKMEIDTEYAVEVFKKVISIFNTCEDSEFIKDFPIKYKETKNNVKNDLSVIK